MSALRKYCARFAGLASAGILLAVAGSGGAGASDVDGNPAAPVAPSVAPPAVASAAGTSAADALAVGTLAVGTPAEGSSSGQVSTVAAQPGSARPAAPPKDPTPIIQVISTASEGSGSLRAAIVQANGSPVPVRIRVDLPRDAVMLVTTALPPLTRPGTEFEGNGATLAAGPGCTRPDGRRGCDGLIISGPDITVRNLTATGFWFDGIAVRGHGAKNVHIADCSAVGNRDDGIGISARATDVLVENCTLTGNGFRSKGKGILVFDGATAVLRNNLIQRNRDGVTVSRHAQAVLEGNMILYSYDKGLGVAAASVEGNFNRIVGNGFATLGKEPVPNGDGLRASLGAVVRLNETVIGGNGDSGVVAMHESHVTLRGGTIESNVRFGVVVRDVARVDLHGVRVEKNVRQDIVVDGKYAVLNRTDPPEFESEPEPEPVSEPDSESESEAGAEPEAESETRPESVRDSPTDE